ncbi:MAG: hypothetical protein AB3N14_02190 [Flavobacteriaceae bacterium]
MISDFFKVLFDYYFLWVYGLAVIIGIWRYPRYFDTPLKYFPILLMYTLLNETFGVLIYVNEQISLIFSEFFSFYNWAIYNIYGIIFYLYFFYVYWCYLTSKHQRRFITYSAIIYAVASIVNPFFQNFMFESQLYSYILGALLLCGCTILYFKDLKLNYGKWFLKRDLLSWISLGILIFYVGYIPIKILRHYEVFDTTPSSLMVRKIHWALILIMYGCFIIGFLIMRRRRTHIES